MSIFYLHSRAIAWVDYDASTKRLQIRFKDGFRVYDFCRVPQHVYAAFVAAPSPRTYYDLYIKDRYGC
jgi:hypothetical protein